jgi:predicted DCC family thiol-disulfide oxidoreductase YuxK
MRATHLILYDAECRFCRWTLGWILRWDRLHELEPVALQDPRAAELLPEMAPEQRLSSWHLVAPDGGVHSAGAAAAPLLRLLPEGGAPAALLAAMPGAVERTYAWTARNRGRLGGRLSERALARADALIADRRGLPSKRPVTTQPEEATR